MANQPDIIPMAWAENNSTVSSIPETTSESGKASWDQGFPVETSLPLSQGGVPPKYGDFNGILKVLSQFAVYAQQGGQFAWNSGLDYGVGSMVLGTDGNLYRAAQASSAVNPVGDTSGKWQMVISAEALAGELSAYQEINTKGWKNTVDYSPGAIVLGSDGNLYVALQPSGPATAAVNPVSGQTHIWQQVTRSGLVAQSTSWHVDADNGDDANDGLTTATAFKTLVPVIERINHFQTPQPSINLYGNHVYELPAVSRDDSDGHTDGVMVWGGGIAPHIHGAESTEGGGYPTLKFIFCVTGTTPETVNKTSRYYTYGYNTQSSGPRIYMSHCNFDHVTIDANYNGVYFEGCFTILNNVEFKVPFRVIGGTLTASDCTFFGEKYIAGGTEYNLWGGETNYAVGVLGAIAMLENTTINVTDGKTTCVGVYSGSTCRINGTFATVAQEAGDGSIGIIQSVTSQVVISTALLGSQTNFGYGIRLVNNSQAFFSSSPIYASWSGVGNGIYNSGNSNVSIAGKPLLSFSPTAIYSETLTVDVTATASVPYSINLASEPLLYAAKVVIETPLATSVPITIVGGFTNNASATVSLTSGFSTTQRYDLVGSIQNEHGLGTVTLSRNNRGAGYVSLGSWVKNTTPVFVGNNGRVTRIDLYTGTVLPAGTAITVYGVKNV